MRITLPRALPLLLAASAIATTQAPACARPARVAADLLVTRASIWTGNPLQPDASALAVIGDRIVDVGGADEMEHWHGRNTTVIDAEGSRLVPGFNDAHVHFVDGGRQLDNVDLKDAPGQTELARRIAERAKATPGEWILGGDWDDQGWTPAALPSRHTPTARSDRRRRISSSPTPTRLARAACSRMNCRMSPRCGRA